MELEIKIADKEYEFEQIKRLNYVTFVDEIPQHRPNDKKELLDKFHHHNTYIIALLEKQLVGMISINDTRPFSLDNKIENLDNQLPPFKKICEIRLLAVKQNHRGGIIFYRLMSFLKDFAISKGFDIAVISGTTRQLKLYKAIGFIEFGSLTGSADALYQPMYLSVNSDFFNSMNKWKRD